MMDKKPGHTVVGRFPDNFFRKEVNEPFIKTIMTKTQNIKEWKKGNPDLFQPDYYGDGKPYEFTIASDKKRRNNFIQNIQNGNYSTNDLEKDMIKYIGERIVDKANKNYSEQKVNLCVLCLLELFVWVSDVYGSETYEYNNYRRKKFFNRIKKEYIDTEIFNNIYIIIPDKTAKWWVFSIATDNRDYYTVKYEHMRNRQYPYVLVKEVYDELVEKGLLYD